MIVDLIVLVISLALILLAAELFTNGVEWIGSHLGLGEGMVGSVLAAVGTAMPETMIPIVAILFLGGAGGHEVGVGAILGAPFMLSTLAMFVTGSAIWIFTRQGRRGMVLRVDQRVLAHDVRYFLVTYTIAAGTAFLPWFGVKLALAALLIVLYVYYVWRHFVEGAEPEGGPPESLHLTSLWHRYHGEVRGRPLEEFAHRLYRIEHELEEEIRHVPRRRWTALQTLGSLVLMVAGANFFVQSVEHIASQIGIPAIILALIIAPIATELPEKFNSVIWVRNGKDTLALGNITGAMVFQSCIPTAIGIAFTAWSISESGATAFISAAVALLAGLTLWGSLRSKGGMTAHWLLLGGIFYLAYLAYLLTQVTQGGGH